MFWPPHLYRQQAAANGVSEESATQQILEAHCVQAKGLPAILSLAHLAKMTGVQRQFLHRVVARQDDTIAYQHFNMKKRGSSGYRRIHVPHPALRLVQRWMVDHMLCRLAPHPKSYAYVRGKADPIRDCARLHCGARWLIRMDLSTFFDSISEVSVYHIFRDLGYKELVAFELARLATWTHEPNETDGKHQLSLRRKRYKDGSPWVRDASYGPYRATDIGSLPQGAPTSPMLANLYFAVADAALDQVAISHGFTYSRYSDDLYFSGQDADRATAQALITAATYAVERHRLHVNRRKTRVSPPGARKVVLGLLVDGTTPRLTRDFRASVRQHLHSVRRNPHEHAELRGFSSVWAMLRHVRGKVDFARSIEPELGDKYLTQLQSALLEHSLV